MASTSTLFLMVLATLAIVVVANPVRTAVDDVMKEASMEDEVILGEPLFVKADNDAKKDETPEKATDEVEKKEVTEKDVDEDTSSPNPHQVAPQEVDEDSDSPAEGPLSAGWNHGRLSDATKLLEDMTKLKDHLHQLVELHEDMEEEKKKAHATKLLEDMTKLKDALHKLVELHEDMEEEEKKAGWNHGRLSDATKLVEDMTKLKDHLHQLVELHEDMKEEKKKAHATKLLEDMTKLKDALHQLVEQRKNDMEEEKKNAHATKLLEDMTKLKDDLHQLVEQKGDNEVDNEALADAHHHNTPPPHHKGHGHHHANPSPHPKGHGDGHGDDHPTPTPHYKEHEHEEENEEKLPEEIKAIKEYIWDHIEKISKTDEERREKERAVRDLWKTVDVEEVKDRVEELKEFGKELREVGGKVMKILDLKDAKNFAKDIFGAVKGEVKEFSWDEAEDLYYRLEKDALDRIKENSKGDSDLRKQKERELKEVFDNIDVDAVKEKAAEWTNNVHFLQGFGKNLMKILDLHDVDNFVRETLKILQKVLSKPKMPPMPPILKVLKKKIWDRIRKISKGDDDVRRQKEHEVEELFVEELEDWEQTQEDFKKVITAVRDIIGKVMTVLDLDDKSEFVKSITKQFIEHGKDKGLDWEETSNEVIDGKHSIGDIEQFLTELFEGFKEQTLQILENKFGDNTKEYAKRLKTLKGYHQEVVDMWNDSEDELKELQKIAGKARQLMHILDLHDAKNFIKDVFKLLMDISGKIKEVINQEQQKVVS